MFTVVMKKSEVYLIARFDSLMETAYDDYY